MSNQAKATTSINKKQKTSTNLAMGSVKTWIIVNRFDIQARVDASESRTLQCIKFPSDLNYADLKSFTRTSIGLSENGNEVMKLRNGEGTLLSFSYLQKGNTQESPLFVDVTRVNQNGIVSSRSALPPSYANTVRGKLATLEQRVQRVETLVPELHSRRQAEVQQTLHQLGSKVHFLDNRIDELLPVDWKTHLQLTSA